MKNKLKILHVEDSEAIYLSVNRILCEIKKISFTCEHAVTLNRALELLSKKQYDLILLDLNLPDSSTEETFYNIREKSKEIPIIVLSVNEDEDTAFKLIKHGAQDYLVKGSFDPDKLYRTIRYALERKQSEKSAYIDTLTGTLNRIPFESILTRAIFKSERNKTRLAVLFLDFEKFKEVNDSYGHKVGDKVLIKAAWKLKSCIRRSDVLCRLGGDEFIICISDINSIDSAVTLAEKINKRFSENIQVENKSIPLTVSIGISMYPDDGKTAQELINNSDLAMYNAKKNKKNSYSIFNPEHIKEMEFKHHLSKALKKNEFVLYYQPIVDKYGKCKYLEALIRWESPIYGLVPPLKFLPILEKNRKIVKVGLWVIKEAINQIKQINNIPEFSDIGMTINLSYYQIKDSNFISDLKNILTKEKVNNLFFEINESSKLTEFDDTLKNGLQDLKDIGVGLFLDDMGTGISSLEKTVNNPLSYVKIDKYIAQKVNENIDYLNIIMSFFYMAKKLNLRTVTKGVEHWKVYDLLKTTGSDYFQGYYFSKPALNIFELLEKSKGYFPIKDETCD